MKQYLSYFVTHFGITPTLIGYTLLCMLITFILTATFGPAIAPQNKSTDKHPILNNINFLKILLTYYIILHHEYQVLGWTNDAQYSVEGFFIISGFMLSYAYTPQKNTIEFITHKLIRFTPYMLLASLLELYNHYSFNPTQFLSGIGMFAYTGLYPKPTLYGPSWYIIVLFWVALFYFVLLKNCSKNICNIIFGLITFATLSATHNISPLLLPQEAPNQYIPLLTNGFVRGLGCIGLGYFLAETYTAPNSKPNKISKLFYTLVEAFLLIYLAYAFFKQNYITSRCVILISFAILIWSFVHQKGYLSQGLEKIKWQPLINYTLPIYMTHWSLCRVQALSQLWAEIAPLPRICLTIVISTILGIIAYQTIDLAYAYSQKKYHKTKLKRQKKK